MTQLHGKPVQALVDGPGEGSPDSIGENPGQGGDQEEWADSILGLALDENKTEKRAPDRG